MAKEFLVYASGLPLDEQHAWSRSSLFGALGLADRVMEDKRVTAVVVRGQAGQGEVVYRVDRECGIPVVKKAFSAASVLALRVSN